MRGRSLYLRAGEVPEGATGLLELTEADEVIWVPFFDTGRLGGLVLFEHMTDPAEAPTACWPSSEQRLI